MQLIRRLSEAHEGINSSAHLIKLVARRFGIESASLRRCDGEGSAEQRRALGILVESKKKVMKSKGKGQYIQSLSGRYSQCYPTR